MISPDDLIRQKSITALKHYCGISLHMYDCTGFKMLTAGNGSLVPKVEGRRMGSSYDPVYEAARWAAAFDEWNDRRTTVAMLGFGTGYHLTELMKHLRPDTEFYVYEPDKSLLYYICGYIDLTPTLETGRVHIFIPDDGQTGSSEQADGVFFDALWEEVVGVSSQALAVRNPYYTENDIFDDACRRVRITTVMNERFIRGRGRLSLQNRMHAWIKLSDNFKADTLLDTLPKDMPIVIVSGGPSLKYNVDDLKFIQGHALIICIDRAVGVLHDHGIMPDLLATVDVVKDVKYLMADEMSNVPLLCSYQTNIAAQDAFNGRLFYFHAWRYENMLPGLAGRVHLNGNVGGSVATAVYTVFAEAGFSDIILVGQDLANRGDETHADGSDDGASVNKAFIEVEGISGEPVWSHADWIDFRDYFEQMIRLHPGTHCIDATEGGALIHGSEIMTLREAAHRFEDRSFSDMISTCIQDAPKAVTKYEQSQICDLMKRWIRELEVFSKTCDEIRDIIKSMPEDAENLPEAVDDMIERLQTLHGSITHNPLFDMMRELWIEEPDIIPDRELYFGETGQVQFVLERESKFCEYFSTACGNLKEAIEQLF